jgi:hypothetical protein
MELATNQNSEAKNTLSKQDNLNPIDGLIQGRITYRNNLKEQIESNYESKLAGINDAIANLSINVELLKSQHNIMVSHYRTTKGSVLRTLPGLNTLTAVNTKWSNYYNNKYKSNHSDELILFDLESNKTRGGEVKTSQEFAQQNTSYQKINPFVYAYFNILFDSQYIEIIFYGYFA